MSETTAKRKVSGLVRPAAIPATSAYVERQRRLAQEEAATRGTGTPADSPAPHSLVRTAKRAKLIFLVLKKVGIDRAGVNAIPVYEPLDRRDVGLAVRQVPQHVKRHGWSDPGQRFYLCSIGKFFLESSRRARLDELAEPGTGVGESPGR